jgi:hypothetical protein
MQVTNIIIIIVVVAAISFVLEIIRPFQLMRSAILEIKLAMRCNKCALEKTKI